VPDKYHAHALARHVAEAHQPAPAVSTLDDQAKQALSDAGAQCGSCGNEPGDRTCPHCQRCLGWYVEALRKAGWAPRAEVLREAADALEADMERFFAVWTDEPRNSPYALGHKDASDEVRRMAEVPRTKTDEAAS
jgi:hypothetical protein